MFVIPIACYIDINFLPGTKYKNINQACGKSSTKFYKIRQEYEKHWV